MVLLFANTIKFISGRKIVEYNFHTDDCSNA